MKKRYDKMEVLPITCSIKEGLLLVDSGKPALTIMPLEAEVDPYTFEDEGTHDFGEVNFL